MNVGSAFSSQAARCAEPPVAARGAPPPDQRQQREQARQQRRRPQHRPLRPLPRRLQPQVSAALLERRPQRPPQRVQADDLLEPQARVGGRQVVVPVGPLVVQDVHPPDRHQRPCAPLPPADPAEEPHVPPAPAVPADPGVGEPAAGAGDRRPGARELRAVLRRPPLAPPELRLGPGRRGQRRVVVEPADEREPASVAVRQAGQVVGGEPAVAEQDEPAAREPPVHRRGHLPRDHGPSLEPPAARGAPLLAAAQAREDGQRPRPRESGEPDDDGRHDPPVAPGADGDAVARPDRVAVAAAAVDLRAAVAGDGVVDGQDDRLVRRQRRDDQPGRHPPQPPHREAGVGQDAVVAAEVPFGQRPEDPQDRRDAPPPRGQDGPDQQEDEPAEHAVGEARGERPDRRLRREWEREHCRLLPEWIADTTTSNGRIPRRHR